MRFRLLAEVDGMVFIKDPITLISNDYLYEFFSDTNKKLVKIGISKHVPKEMEDSFGLDIKPGKGEMKAVFDFKSDDKFYEELIRKLKELESHLGFSTVGGLRRIYWENPNIEYVPENNSIEETVKASSIKINKQHVDKKFPVSEIFIVEIIKQIEEQEYLFIPKSFWLMGSNLYKNFQYVLSFYQFYFVIEGLYANGKFHNKDVLKEFRKSSEFNRICNNLLNDLKIKLPEFFQRLNQSLTEEGLDYSSSGIQEYIINMRGRLHHYSSKSPLDKPTPMNQDRFKNVAFIMMWISSQSILSQAGENKETKLPNL